MGETCAIPSPMRGTESEVAGMISATSSMKTVSESSTVIPAETEGGRVFTTPRNQMHDTRALTMQVCEHPFSELCELYV